MITINCVYWVYPALASVSWDRLLPLLQHFVGWKINEWNSGHAGYWLANILRKSAHLQIINKGNMNMFISEMRIHYIF